MQTTRTFSDIMNKPAAELTKTDYFEVCGMGDQDAIDYVMKGILLGSPDSYLKMTVAMDLLESFNDVFDQAGKTDELVKDCFEYIGILTIAGLTKVADHLAKIYKEAA